MNQQYEVASHGKVRRPSRRLGSLAAFHALKYAFEAWRRGQRVVKAQFDLQGTNCC